MKKSTKIQMLDVQLTAAQHLLDSARQQPISPSELQIIEAMEQLRSVLWSILWDKT